MPGITLPLPPIEEEKEKIPFSPLEGRGYRGTPPIEGKRYKEGAFHINFHTGSGNLK